jgi:hypothetical protein
LPLTLGPASTMTWPFETPATITPKESPPTIKPLASVPVAKPSNEIDELPLKAKGAIGSIAAWVTDAKSITAIIDFIILAVNLVNPAIASLYFRPLQKNIYEMVDDSSFRIRSSAPLAGRQAVDNQKRKWQKKLRINRSKIGDPIK